MGSKVSSSGISCDTGLDYPSADLDGTGVAAVEPPPLVIELREGGLGRVHIIGERHPGLPPTPWDHWQGPVAPSQWRKAWARHNGSGQDQQLPSHVLRMAGLVGDVLRVPTHRLPFRPASNVQRPTGVLGRQRVVSGEMRTAPQGPGRGRLRTHGARINSTAAPSSSFATSKPGHLGMVSSIWQGAAAFLHIFQGASYVRDTLCGGTGSGSDSRSPHAPSPTAITSEPSSEPRKSHRTSSSPGHTSARGSV